jgi:hypothetical protein
MSRPFQPPSTAADGVDQLRNLHRALARFRTVAQLPADATDAEARNKINEILSLLSAATTGEAARRSP